MIAACDRSFPNGDAVAGEDRDASGGGAAAGGAFLGLLDLCFFAGCVGGSWCGGAVRPRGQEDEAREAIQGLVRERKGEAEDDDPADQGPGRGPQVHALAASLQAHLTFQLGSRSGLLSPTLLYNFFFFLF